jgi:hypothetical protein
MLVYGALDKAEEEWSFEIAVLCVLYELYHKTGFIAAAKLFPQTNGIHKNAPPSFPPLPSVNQSNMPLPHHM